MSKIVVEFESVGEKELARSFGALEKSASGFEKSVAGSGKAAGKSSAELQNLAKLNERLARIQLQQAKGTVSASQAQVGAAKARIAAVTQETAILIKQGASRDKLAGAARKLAAEQVKLSQAEAAMAADRQKAIAAQEKAAQKQIADQAKIAAAAQKASAEQKKAAQEQIATQSKLEAAQARAAAERAKQAQSEQKLIADRRKSAQEQVANQAKIDAAQAKAATEQAKRAAAEQKINAERKRATQEQLANQAKIDAAQAKSAAEKVKLSAAEQKLNADRKNAATEQLANQAKLDAAQARAAAERAKQAQSEQKLIADRRKASAEQLAVQAKAAAAQSKATQEQIKIASVEVKLNAERKRAASEQVALAAKIQAAQAKAGQEQVKKSAIESKLAADRKKAAQEQIAAQAKIDAAQTKSATEKVRLSAAEQKLAADRKKAVTEQLANQAKLDAAQARAAAEAAKQAQSEQKVLADQRKASAEQLAAQAKVAAARAKAAQEQIKIASVEAKLAGDRQKAAADQVALAAKMQAARAKATQEQIKLESVEQRASAQRKKEASEQIATQAKVTVAQTKAAQERVRLAAAEQKVAADRKKAAQEQVANQAKIAAAQAKASQEQVRILQAEQKLSSARQKSAQDQALAQQRLASAQTKAAADQVRLQQAEERLAASRKRTADQAAASAAREAATAAKKAAAQQQAIAVAAREAAQAKINSTLYDRIARIQQAQSKGTVSASQAAIGISKAKQAAIRQEIAALKDQGVSADKLAQAKQKLAGEELRGIKATNNYAAEKQKAADALKKLDTSAKSAATGGLKQVNIMFANLQAAAITKGLELAASGFKALGDQAKKSVQEFADLDQGLTTFRAIQGLEKADQQFVAVEQEVKRLGATTTFTAAQMADLSVSLSRGGLSSDLVATSLDAASKAAIASSTDLTEMGKVITNVGNVTMGGAKSVEDFNRIADVLVTTANKSATDVSLLGESFKNVGPLAKALGFEIEDTATYLALFAKAGISGAEAGTALRGAMDRLGPGLEGLRNSSANLTPAQAKLRDELKNLGLGYSDFVDSTGRLDAAKTFEALGGAMEGISSRTEKARVINALFGQEYGSKVLGVIDQSPAAFTELATAIGDSGGAAEQTADIMLSSLSAQFEILGSAVSGFRTAIGESLAPILEPLLGEASAFFGSLTDILSGGGGGALTGVLGDVVGGLLGEVQSILATIDFSFLANIFSTLVPVIQGVGKAFAQMNLGEKIGELVNAFGTIGEKYFSTLGSSVGNFAIVIGEAFGAVIEVVSVLLDTASNLGIFDIVFTAAQGAITVVIGALNILVGITRTLVGVLRFIQPLLSVIGFVVKGILLPFQMLFKTIQFISQGIAKLGGMAVWLVKEYFALGKRFRAFIFDSLRTPLQMVLDRLQGLVDIWNKIPGLPQIKLPRLDGKDLVDAAGEAGKAAGEALRDGGDLAEAGEELGTAGGEAIVSALGEVDSEGGVDEFVGEINDGADQIKEEQEKRLAELESADVEQDLSLQQRVNTGELTTAESAKIEADATLEQAEEKLRILRETNASAEELAKQELEVEKAKNAAMKAERDQALAELDQQMTQLEAEVQRQINAGAITETEASAQMTALAAQQAERKLEILKATNASAEELAKQELEIEKAKNAAMKAERDRSFAEMEQAQTELQKSLQQQINAGAITSTDAADQEAALALEQARQKLGILRATNASAEEIAKQELEIEKAKNAAMQAERAKGLEGLQEAQTALNLELQSQLNDREITEAQAATRRAGLAVENAEKELQVLRRTGATDEEIQAQRLKVAESYAALREAKIAEALDDLKGIEEARLADIAALELTGAIGAREAEQLKANAGVQSAKERLAALKKLGASEEEIQKASIDLLTAQQQAEQAIIDTLKSRVDLQAELTGAQLQAQVQAIEASNRALERQKGIIDAIAGAEAAQLSLDNTLAQIQLDRLKRGEELLTQRDQLLGKAEEITEEEQKARDLATVESELRDRGFDPNANAIDLLKQRQALEDQAAARQREAQQQELARKRQTQAIEAQLADAAARRAIFEAKIAEASAQQAALKAQIDNAQIAQDRAAAQQALVSGTDEEKDAARQRLAELDARQAINDLTIEGAALARQNTQDAIANAEAVKRANELASQGLDAQQREAIAQANAEENERRIQAANERQQAGLARGQVQLLPTDGDGLDTERDTRNAQALSDIEGGITREAAAQNELSAERQALNKIEIAQQEELLRLQRERAKANNRTETTTLPSFRDGGRFDSPGLSLVGEAGPELVHLGGRGRVYNAKETARALRSLAAPVPALRTVVTPAAPSDSLIQEIQGLRRDLAKAPRQTVINQRNTANLRSLDHREVADIVRRSHREGLDYLMGLL
jgi:hypothetical protein